MGRRRRELPLLEGVRIEDVAAEGKALARVGGMVVFVPFAVPGDVADLRVTRRKAGYAEAVVASFRELSPGRAEPFCPHFGVCGGCKWQCLPYGDQLEMKRRQVRDCLERIARVELPEVEPALGSPRTVEYRNKLEFGCSPRRWLTPGEIASGAELGGEGAVGFHAGGSFDKILPVETCRLMDPVNDRVRLAVRDYAIGHGLTFHDQREHRGLLRGLMLRLGNEGGLMVLLQFCMGEEGDGERARGLMENLRERVPEITSLLWVDNRKWNDTLEGLEVRVFSGEPHIFLRMEGLRFKVGPKSFYQTNTEQALELYRTVREMARLTGGELVYDLYTGTGTIANFVASRARRVIGIEYVPEAVEDARENSRLNGVGNTLFFAGDMRDILTPGFVREHGRPDVVITDPPRAGMHSDVTRRLLEAAPGRVVYVSCNPATQARDIALLDEGYRVARVRPVDMFPHTQHVESVVLLERR